MKVMLKITLAILGPGILSLIVWHLFSFQPIAKYSDIKSNFKGSFLAISDADMIATAYANGQLNRIDSIKDSLFFIKNHDIKSRINTSNSVISWPAIIAYHPTLPIAYVAETRGVADNIPNKIKDPYSDFPKGKVISVVDYRNPESPIILQDTMIGENLQNVTINNKGDLLVAGSTIKGKELLVAQLENGRIQQTTYFSSTHINTEDHQDGGFRSAAFHPTENVIAVNLNGKSVAFFRCIQQNNQLGLEAIGSPLQVGKKLSVGNWHPSGQFFIISDVGWGKGNLGFVLNGKGKLNSIRFDLEGQHSIASQVKVGLSPEGFDVSPDGSLAIAVNMRRTYLPSNYWFIPARKGASLSLIGIDAQTGTLTPLQKPVGFEGALPEDAIFDQESNSIAVAVYQKQDEANPTQGWVEFWEIKDKQLFRTDRQLKLTRGVHNLLLINQ